MDCAERNRIYYYDIIRFITICFDKYPLLTNIL